MESLLLPNLFTYISNISQYSTFLAIRQFFLIPNVNLLQFLFYSWETQEAANNLLYNKP